MRGRRLVGAALAVLLSGSLAACGADGKQVPDATVDEKAYPVVAEVQARTILQAVDTALAGGIDVKDVQAADARLVGPFRQMEIAQARSASRNKKAQRRPAAIQQMRLVVPAQAAWPRFFLAIGNSRTESTPLVQVLTTKSARVPFGLWAQASMLPGATLPQTASIATGAPAVPLNDTGLTLAPRDVLKGYASYLNTGGRGKGAKSFRRSTFSDQLDVRLKADQKELKKVSATVSSKHAPVSTDNSTFAVRTSDGGALVIGALDQMYTISVKKGKGTVKLTDPELAGLAKGKKSFSRSFTRHAMEVLVFQVPPKGSGPISVIAAQKGDIGALAK